MDGWKEESDAASLSPRAGGGDFISLKQREAGKEKETYRK